MSLSRVTTIVAAVKVLALSVLAVSLLSAAAPNVTYTASGNFSAVPTSGGDTLKLAGEPFSISIVANAASVPKQYGPNWAIYTPLRMTGTVHSGLLGPTPVAIASDAASIALLWGPDYDLFVAGFPVRVVGIALTIRATITMPPGTIINQLIHPFAPVALDTTNSVVTYSDGADTTTLTVDSGTLVATIPSPSKSRSHHAALLSTGPDALAADRFRGSLLMSRRRGTGIC